MNRLAWITGAAGLIGHHLVAIARQTALPWSPRPLTRAELDLTDAAAVERLFRTETPALIIHCAALSRSPTCEEQPNLARRVNVDVTAHLASLAAGIPFWFFSSDLVFDGQQGGYRESDPVGPLSVYGQTKAAAEAIVLQNPNHTVIRTSLNAGTSPTGNRSFTEQMLDAWRRNQSLTLFTDEYRSPLPAPSTARAVWELVQQGLTGVIHVAGPERLSRWEIGQVLAAAHPELPCRMHPASLREYRGAPRPPDTSLNSAQAQARLSFPLPSLAHWLRNL